MLSVNQHLREGRYVLLNKLLVKSGMGEVWVAKDMVLKIDVAIKIVKPENQNQQSLEVFQREFERHSKLKHEGIPQIRDFFEEDNQRFLVMDFVPGDDLRKRIEDLKAQRKEIPLEEILNWFDQLLDILIYIHKKGIIHRDIKPENIKITERNKVKLLDFGISKGSVGIMTVGITTTVGFSPVYASIEQLLHSPVSRGKKRVEGEIKTDAGKNIAGFSAFHREKVLELQNSKSSVSDVRDDLFSLGTVIYEICLKTHPPKAEHRAVTVWDDRPDPLDGIALNNEIPSEIAEIILQSLAFERAKRFSSVLEMRKELNTALENIKQKKITTQIENQRIKLEGTYQVKIKSIEEKYQKNILQVSKEKDYLTTDNQKLKKLIDNLKEGVKIKEASLKANQTKIVELQVLLDNKDTKIVTLENESKELKANAEKVETALFHAKDDLQTRISDLSNQNKKLKREKSDGNIKIGDLSKKLNQVQKTVEKTLDEKDKIKIQLLKKQQIIDSKQEEIDFQLLQIEELENNFEEKEKSFLEEYKKLEKDVKLSKETITKISEEKDEKDKLSNELNEVKKIAKDLFTEKKKIENLLKEKQNTIDNLASELKEKEEKIEEVKEKLKSFEEVKEIPQQNKEVENKPFSFTSKPSIRDYPTLTNKNRRSNEDYQSLRPPRTFSEIYDDGEKVFAAEFFSVEWCPTRQPLWSRPIIV